MDLRVVVTAPFFFSHRKRDSKLILNTKYLRYTIMDNFVSC